MQSSLLQRRGNTVTAFEITSADIDWQLSLRANAELANNSFLKRLFDVMFTAVLCVFVFSWLFPLIALVVRVSSKGPVFFKQTRTGLYNNKIIFYKFRTMSAGCTNVDESGNYLQAVENDPRITKIGALLRRTSLDELPQFWNVLKGDMSIIGPRPHPVELDKESEKMIEHYHLRYLVKPGITGWAQVSGFRGPTKKNGSMQKRVEHDLWYIQNWDLLLDGKVVLKTIKTAFWRDENAY